VGKVIVCKKYFDRLNANNARGATLTEVILAIAVIIAVSPFMYNQIIEMSNESEDIAHANEIVNLRDSVVNYIRINQEKWADVAEIKLSDEELQKISSVPHSGYIDKYKVNGASISDVYLAFNMENSGYRAANIAKQIGEDAAVVREDGIAYSQSWAVSAPEDFHVGDLIFRISYDFEGADKSRFLHRGTMGEDKLNQMQRNLHMNNFNVFNVAKIDGLSAKITDVDAVFLESDVVDANTVYFTSGANMNSDSITFSSMRVTGDTSGFRLIKADVLNDDKYTTNGKLIVDRATIGNSVNVAGNLVLKSSSGRSVSGFSGISTNKLLTPYLSATDLVFFENFGITVSSELLLAGKAPLKIGNWTFPSTTPPSFSKLILTRASVPPTPDADEFNKIIEENWNTK
jgi:hypothetical protein